jgi:hypothetical protein
VKLHRSGASLREIADGLGMSHQRVHQIVSPHEDKQRSRKKTTVIAGPVSTVLILALGGVLVVSSLRVPDRPTSRATPSSSGGGGRSARRHVRLPHLTQARIDVHRDYDRGRVSEAYRGHPRRPEKRHRSHRTRSTRWQDHRGRL